MHASLVACTRYNRLDLHTHTPSMIASNDVTALLGVEAKYMPNVCACTPALLQQQIPSFRESSTPKAPCKRCAENDFLISLPPLFFSNTN